MEEEAIYSLDQLLDSFQSSLEALDEQLQLLRILDADSAPSWPGMNQAVDVLKQACAHVAHKCSEQDQIIRGQNKDIDALKHDGVNLADRLELSEKEGRMLSSKLKFLEKEVEKLELKQHESQAIIKDLKAKHQSLQTQHKDTLEYKRSVEEALNAKEQELVECQQMIEEQTDAHEATKKQLELTKAGRDELHVDLKKSEAACEARVHDLHAARVQCEELVRSKAQLTEELRQKKLAHEDCQLKLKNSDSELERLRQWHTWLKQAEQERLVEQREKHDKEMQRLLKQINEMKVSHERVVSQHSTEKASREVVESQMHKLEQDAWVRASELKSLHKEQQTLTEDNKRLGQQAESLRLAKDELIEEKTKIMMKLAEVESELKKTGSEGKMEVKAIVSKHQAEISEVEKISKVLQAEKEGLTRELTRLQEEHDNAHVSLSVCERELKELKGERDGLLQDKMKLEGEVKSTQQTLDRALQRMQRQSSASAAEINRLKNIQENILDTQLAREREQQYRFQQKEHRQQQNFELASEAQIHLAAANAENEKDDSVENHALNRVKLLLQSIENEHSSVSPIK